MNTKHKLINKPALVDWACCVCLQPELCGVLPNLPGDHVDLRLVLQWGDCCRGRTGVHGRTADLLQRICQVYQEKVTYLCGGRVFTEYLPLCLCNMNAIQLCHDQNDWSACDIFHRFLTECFVLCRVSGFYLTVLLCYYLTVTVLLILSVLGFIGIFRIVLHKYFDIHLWRPHIQPIFPFISTIHSDLNVVSLFCKTEQIQSSFNWNKDIS